MAKSACHMSKMAPSLITQCLHKKASGLYWGWGQVNFISLLIRQTNKNIQFPVQVVAVFSEQAQNSEGIHLKLGLASTCSCTCCAYTLMCTHPMYATVQQSPSCTHTPIYSAPLIQRISIVHQPDTFKSEVYVYVTYTYTCVLQMHIYAQTYAPMYCKPTLDEKLKTVDLYSITS